MLYKNIILIILLLTSAIFKTYSQDLVVYEDTLHHFKMMLPEGWKLIPGYKETILFVYRESSEKKVETVNLTQFSGNVSNVEEAFESSLTQTKSREGFVQILESGISNNKNYKWYIEQHQNKNNKEIIMETLICIYYFNGIITQLTCGSFPESFDKYQSLFVKMADSLVLQ